MNKAASILLVDDDRFFAALHSQHLRSLGYEIRLAETAADGFERARKFRPDLIVADGLLPDRSGIDMIHSLREVGYSGRIIFLSSFWKDIGTFRHLKQDLGVLKVLHKPISPEELALQIGQALAEPLPVEKEEPLSDDLPALVDDTTPESQEDDAVSRTEPEEAAGRMDASGLPQGSQPVTEPSALEQEGTENKAETEVADPLTQLIAEYRDGIGRRVQEIYDTWRRHPVEQLSEVRRKVHSLHGTAGTYGLTAVSDAAAELDELLLMILDGGEVEEEVLDDRWRKLLEAAGTMPVDPGARTEPVRMKRFRQSVMVDPSSRIKILIFDPDPRSREQIAGEARQSLVEVLECGDEDQVIAMIEEHNPDAVFVCESADDIRSRAWRLLQRLKIAFGDQQLPVVFVSENDDLRARISAHQAGCTLFLNRPVQPRDILDSIRIASSLRRQGRARVLIVDDDPGFYHKLATDLSKAGFDVSATNHPEEVLEVIDDVDPEVLILDMIMPKFSGADLCRILRTLPKWYDLPIIMMTADAGEKTRLEAFEAGADDLIIKPLSIKEVVARLSLRVVRNRILSDRIDRDPLTGVLLRRSFVERCGALIRGNRREQKPGAMVMIDLDHFKDVNDTYGHAVGDAVLVALASFLTARLRGSDVIGRWGGEEFVVYMPDCDREAAFRVMEEIRNDFREREFQAGSETFRISCSAGICGLDEADSMRDLIVRADERLYLAKNLGRDRVVADDEAAVSS